ncbi:ESCRT-II complex subunit [Podospora didyma]|uniref:ESCRT-II complex subunit VPS25 n=1 Tax=Podospora didyma TaxID=330526 RepID=A0AAE0TVS7_9PEZI|nr:ESCRT-II complex subunit [Podospora didyma]
MSITTTTTPPFSFPREYSFPPFFTRQTNLTTHHAQLTKWASLVLAYCRHHRIFKLTLSGIPVTSSSSSASANEPTTITTTSTTPQQQKNELFHNSKINRRLSLADAREVFDFLRKDGRAEYILSNNKDSSFSAAPEGGIGGVGGGGGGGGDVVWVYWRTPEEWAALIEAWVEQTGQKGSVLTLYELTEGDTTCGTEFHGLDPDLLQKALSILVKRAKAQIFGQEDSQGVKFF